ncbi:excinuclease ABC subunit UvrA [Arcanobacterium haemolyticum]|nr:excinuclease ABC subunit UvrA [Arcanobacterium haemolyticum]
MHAKDSDNPQDSGFVVEADNHDAIRVYGARENNLQDVTLSLPKRRLTVFTGVSGSGKSSLVFETIAAESQRMINETYSAFLQSFMPSLERPDVDKLEGITTAIIVDQERMGDNPRSTVGTATDVFTMLRILFSRLGEPHHGSPQAFSFNVPTVTATGALKVEKGEKTQAVKRTFSSTGGMCPTCEGLGTIKDIDLDEILDMSKSLDEDPFNIPGYKAGGWNHKIYAESGFFDTTKPLSEYSKREMHNLLYHEPEKRSIAGMNMTYEGLIPRIQKSLLSKDPDSMQAHVRAFADRAVTFRTCPDCQGTRLSEGARSSKIKGVSIAEAADMQISDLLTWIRSIDDDGVRPLLESIDDILSNFVDIGLGYLSLSRSAASLSGGEAQRTKMVKHVGSSLTDITYIFDEPSVGLHPHDIDRMNRLLLRLRDKGNTVLVVEHKPETIAIADHVVDLGPGAGKNGGRICFEGSVEELRESDTLTGRHLADRVAVKKTVRKATGTIRIENAHLHNLRDVSVDVPLGVMVAVTGVAGSGKSSLIHGCLPQQTPDGGEIIKIDQAPIKGSSRSNLATYTSILEPIRKAFAKANGVKPALFSANSEGACPACKGAGTIYTPLGMMSGVTTTCEVCEGRRFEASVFEYKLAGKSIGDVYEMRVEEALEFFSGEAKIASVKKMLTNLVKAGLGYVSLGQPLSTLSGGERQRLKLASHLGDKGGVFVLDEPTTGLHLADIEKLLTLLDTMVDDGRTVIVIEHHLAVVAHADWVIDMGPGAGHDGGRVVFEGTPAELAATHTLTGKYLANYLG